MAAPQELTTSRLVLRRPRSADAVSIFERFAADPEVTRFLSWPRHRSVDDSLEFVHCSDEIWSAAPAGPYLVLDADGELLGSTGLDVETPSRAATGYVLARVAWGRGYATEVAGAMVALAAALRVTRLYALCHVENHASARVLAKAGFACEGVLRRHTVFPNVDAERPCDVECWGHI